MSFYDKWARRTVCFCHRIVDRPVVRFRPVGLGWCCAKVESTTGLRRGRVMQFERLNRRPKQFSSPERSDAHVAQMLVD